MFGLTSLGIFHTAISLVALAAGLTALARTGAISMRTGVGKLYVWTTALTCITGFGIFQHGGFGKPHLLGVITLLTLGVAWAAGKGMVFGRLSPYVEAVAYSLTVFFHFVPALAETLTRLPLGGPLLDSPEDPVLQGLDAFLFLLFLIGATLQVRELRGSLRSAGTLRSV